MTYTELRDITEKKGILIKSVAAAVDMTTQGLQASIENQTIPAKKILPLCKILGITLNEFFGVEDQRYGDVIHGNQNKFGRKQIINENKETIKILQDQLATKDEQIKMLMELLKSKNHE